MADGCIIAPLSRCEPGVRPFSIRATGTSPSCSSSRSSSASSCISRFAHASPAGPPPTIAIPTSIRSSAASSKAPMNSFSDSTGGGNSIGAIPVAMAGSAALLRLDRVGELGDDLVQISDHTEVGELEDRRVLVLVDRDDVLRGLHTDLVLDRARDAEREVELRCDRLTGLADLRGVGVPARVDDRARRGHGAAECAGEVLGELEVLGLAEPASTAHEQVGVLDVHVGAALLAALHELRLGRPVGQRHVDLLDLRRAVAGLVHLERVESPDDDPGLADVVDVHDRRVLEDRALGDELAVLRLDRRDLHRHAGVQARGEAGPDLEAEQAAAEQRVAVAVVLDQLRHHVDDRLREALWRPRDVGLRRAVLAELRGEIGRQVVAVADEHRVRLLAELVRELGGLGDRAERVLVELAVVVEYVGEDPAHARSFLSSSHDTIFSTVSSVSSSSMISPASFSGGGLMDRTRVLEPSSPTLPASIWTSPVDFVSSGFFFAPMIALSDG